MLSSSRQAISQHLDVLEDAGLVRSRKGGQMRINLASVLVDNQAKALQFYTDVLGFVKKTDVPLGEHRWLTVRFTQEPADMGPVTTAVLDDTCGNLIQIAAQQ